MTHSSVLLYANDISLTIRVQELCAKQGEFALQVVLVKDQLMLAMKNDVIT